MRSGRSGIERPSGTTGSCACAPMRERRMASAKKKAESKVMEAVCALAAIRSNHDYRAVIVSVYGPEAGAHVPRGGQPPLVHAGSRRARAVAALGLPSG